MDEEPRIDLQHGRKLDIFEQSKLIIAIDRLLNVPEINAVCHFHQAAGDPAEEIETLLTEAGWYPK